MARAARLQESFTHVPRTLRLVWRSSAPATLTLAALTLVSAVLPLSVAWAGKRIIDAVVAGARDQALRWVIIELALIAGSALVQRTLALVRQVLGLRLSVDINVLILEKALTLELRHFEDAEFYDLLTRARREASSRPVSVVSEIFQLIQNGLTLFGYAALLIGFSGWAVLGLLVAAVPATVVEMRFSNVAFRLRNWRSPETRKLNYLEYVLANDEHAKEVKAFGIGPMMLDRYRTLGERFYKEDRRLAIRRATWSWALSLLATGAFYACYAVMAVAAARGRLSLGNLTLYVVAFRQGQQAFQSCLTAIGGMYEDSLYMSNLYKYLGISVAAPLASEASAAPAALPALPAPAPAAPAATVDAAEQGIRFDGVGFRYPKRTDWALREVSFFLARGGSLALVGHNGAGKTTLIKLLLRMYEPSEGRILLDGRDLRDLDADELRSRVGVVFQDFAQYQLALRENVGVGSVAHLADEPRLLRAVASGGADEVVSALPEGLDAHLGTWFEKGHELSGGQWQKVALARAFMREEADVLILDEPTAALDAEAEHAVFARFRALAAGRTTILISHRFPTVRMADRILVLDGGRIIEQGTHAELVAAGGRYASLFTLQAKGYL